MPNQALDALAQATGIGEGEAGHIYMRQHWSMFEAITGGMYEKANVYDVYNGNDDNKYEVANQIMRIEARSTNCERTCCAPAHSIMLHVKDLEGNTIITIQRPGFGSGKYCLGSCCALTDCCQDGIIVHEGKVEAEPACCSLGNPCCDGCGHGDLKNPNPISKAQVPMCGGGCSPNVHIYEEVDSAEPNGSLSGPFIFGGCTELCCESTFKYSTKDGREVSRVQKLVPRSVEALCQELFTDSDKYKIEFYEGSTGEEKANAIGLSLLADYMFFERDLGIITYITKEDGTKALKCTLCLTYCCGQVCPCSCNCESGGPGENQGGGGGDDGGAPLSQEMQR